MFINKYETNIRKKVKDTKEVYYPELTKIFIHKTFGSFVLKNM